jgi:GntR family transcriptional regulator
MICGIFISRKSLSFNELINTMQFHVEKSSSIPIVKQIQDQIKLSIAMGVLKRGDILPSIREVEKQTGINRGQIHRAFLALQQSGLLSPTPSKRIAVAISATAPASVNKKCQELTREIIQRLRKIGISPIAYASYLSRSAQEDERKSPFIAYVDWDKKNALRRAEQISQLWKTAVAGLSADEYKSALAHRSKLRKVLVNHLAFDGIRNIPSRRRIDIIPIEIRYTAKTIRALERTRVNSSLLIVFPNHTVPVADFIVDQLHKLIIRKGVKISWIAVNKQADFEQLLDSSQCDRILVSPGARNKVPAGRRRVSRIFQLEMEFDPEGLEIARIRAGVIV